MSTKITHLELHTSPPTHTSPRSPRNKIQRKPDNTRPKPYQNPSQKIKSNPNEFLGFYSPKHQPALVSSPDLSQSTKLTTLQPRTLKNQRSLAHFRKPDYSIIHIDQNQNRNKQNSISNSSQKSMNSRKISRLQLELKAVTYENTRLKAENKTLLDENYSLKAEARDLVESVSTKSIPALKSPTPPDKPTPNQKINKLISTISILETELKQAREKIFLSESLIESNHNLETYIKSLESINTEQREEIFRLDKANKYMEIEVRTLKKQKVIGDGNRKLKEEMGLVEADNKRLRKMVIELQTRVRGMMIFELTPDVSESESFLLD